MYSYVGSMSCKDTSDPPTDSFRGRVRTVTSGSTVSYTDTAVNGKSGTTYTYAVRPYYGSTMGYYTGKSILRIDAGTVSSLTNTSSGITVSWSKITGASGYYVYRKTSSGSYSKIKTVTSGSTLSYTDTAVKDNNYESSVTKEATCEEDGAITYTCSRCGESYTETVEATGHDYELTETTEDICTEGGFATYTCRNCEGTYVETVSTAGHAAGEWEVQTEATCAEDGLMVEKCIYCDEILDTKTIAATGEHTREETGYYEEFENKRNAGYQYLCHGCGFTTTDNETIASHCGHEKCAYSSEIIWETYTDSVWVSTGYKCSVCGATK